MYKEEKLKPLFSEDQSELLEEFAPSSFPVKINCNKIITVAAKTKKLADKHSGVCLSSAVDLKGSFEWRCSKGHVFIRNYNKMRDRNSFCPTCNKPNSRVDLKDDCIKIATKHGGLFLSEKYETSLEHYDWQCKKGHNFKALRGNVTNGHWCPYCINKTEEKVRHIFQSLFNKPFPKHRPKWLTYLSGKRLELDGYCEQLGIAFEYDGEYHFKPHYNNPHYDLSKRQLCDAFKTTHCAWNNVTLIRIPYTEKANLYNYILQKLKELFYVIKI